MNAKMTTQEHDDFQRETLERYLANIDGGELAFKLLASAFCLGCLGYAAAKLLGL